MRRFVALALGTVAVAGAAQAQAIGGGLGAAYVSREVQRPTGERLSGLAGEGQVALRVRKAGLKLRYLQGRVGRDGGSNYDLVEGQAALSVFPLPWAYLGVGPLVRSYSAGGLVERWVSWEGHLGLTTGIVGPAVRGYLELARTVAGSVNLPARFDPGQGFEAGLLARLPPLWARLGYRLDHGGAGGGARVETVELFVLRLGIGNP